MKTSGEVKSFDGPFESNPWFCMVLFKALAKDLARLLLRSHFMAVMRCVVLCCDSGVVIFLCFCGGLMCCDLLC